MGAKWWLDETRGVASPHFLAHLARVSTVSSLKSSNCFWFCSWGFAKQKLLRSHVKTLFTREKCTSAAFVVGRFKSQESYFWFVFYLLLFGKATLIFFLPRRDRDDPVLYVFHPALQLQDSPNSLRLLESGKIWGSLQFQLWTQIYSDGLANPAAAGVVDFSGSRLEDQRPCPEGKQDIRASFCATLLRILNCSWITENS